MVDSSREAFNGFRKTRKGYLVDEESFFAGWQSSRSAAIEECAAIAKREQRHWANPETETALLNVEAALRALKGEG